MHDEDQLYDIVDVLVEIAEARGVSAAQVALAWPMPSPGNDTGDGWASPVEQRADSGGAADRTG